MNTSSRDHDHTASAVLEELRELKAALEPIHRFIEAFDAKPPRQLDDAFYGIHLGTEWGAELRLSDLRRVGLLSRPKQVAGASSRDEP